MKPAHSAVLHSLRWVHAACILATAHAGAEPNHSARTITNITNAPDAFVLPRWEWIHPFPSPRLLPVRFPAENPARSVTDIVWSNDRWWVIAEARSGVKPDDLGANLWAFSPVQNRIERVRGVMDAFPPHALWSLGKEVWVALPEGVAALHTASLVAEGFNSYQGLFRQKVAGFAESDGLFVAMSTTGEVSTLGSTGTNWISTGLPASERSQRNSDPWSRVAGSVGNIAAVQTESAFVRPLRGSSWMPVQDRLNAGSPRLEPNTVHTVTGDGDGGFWFGSDAGLHHLASDREKDRNQFSVPGILVKGLVPVANPTWFRHSAEAIVAAREQVAFGIRTRMRDRARHARASLESGVHFDPVTPLSRIPGPVKVVLRDGPWLWIATAEPGDAGRSRVLLFHTPSELWFGWFPIGVPVRCLSANTQWLAIGVDASSTKAGEPFLLIEKAALFSVPASRRVAASISAGELGDRLASMTVKERALHAFFARDARRVVELLSPNEETLDAESLFLLSFAHDPIGLGDDTKKELYLGQLHKRHAKSIFAEMLQVPPASAPQVASSTNKPVSAAAAAPTPDAVPNTTLPNPGDAKPSTAPEIQRAEFDRRDINKDGRLNFIELRLWLGADADIRLFDTDGNGVLSFEEVTAHSAAFAR